MEKDYILAIDIGGTSIKIGVVNKETIYESTSVRNTFKGKSHLLVKGIYDICNQYIKKYNIHKIGIGCPGDIINGIVIFASNLGYKNYNIQEDFQLAFPNCQIKVENDGNAACLAEMKYGYLKNTTNGLFVTIGRGIGGAIIFNNNIIHGYHNRGGKFGHIVIKYDGRKCNCGRTGCFETYGSVLGLIQTIKELNRHSHNEQEKVDTTTLSGFKIVEYCKANNPIVLKAVKQWNEDLAEGFLDLVYIFDPAIIVLAGGITDSGLIDIDFIKEKFAELDYKNCDIKLAKFTGKTGLIGAASLFE